MFHQKVSNCYDMVYQGQEYNSLRCEGDTQKPSEKIIMNEHKGE